MEELRIRVWDHLFRVSSPQTIEEIVDKTSLDHQTVVNIIDHPWFEYAEDRVTIAYATK